MRVKIGHTWHDSVDQPLAVQLTHEELALVKEIDPENSNRKFASGQVTEDDPDGEKLLEWLRAE